jgi:hypothetical protein
MVRRWVLALFLVAACVLAWWGLAEKKESKSDLPAVPELAKGAAVGASGTAVPAGDPEPRWTGRGKGESEADRTASEVPERLGETEPGGSAGADEFARQERSLRISSALMVLQGMDAEERRHRLSEGFDALPVERRAEVQHQLEAWSAKAGIVLQEVERGRMSEPERDRYLSAMVDALEERNEPEVINDLLEMTEDGGDR